MSILTPLGLVALLGLIILFLIYFIKPTYQNKVLSSTYIWKESLKYKKSTRPASKFRNILLVILQCLIIIIATIILITPVVYTSKINMREQSIIILDSSASMLTSSNDRTRFDRAIDEIEKFAKSELKDNRPVSIIYGGHEPYFVVKSETSMKKINGKLSSLSCEYGNGNIAGAMDLAKEMIESNAKASIYYYTGTSYNKNDDIKIVNVSGNDEWNIAILDAEALNVENYYEFNVSLASYGVSKYVNVYLTVEGVNDDNKTVSSYKRINLASDEERILTFKDLDIYAFDSAYIEIKSDDGLEDSFPLDNSFNITGGRLPEINIQYYSKSPNNFFNGALNVLKNRVSSIFDVNITSVEKLDEAKNKGFDFYIYEHLMPQELPTDGLVLLVNPDYLPPSLGVELGSEVSGSFNLGSGINHEIMKYIDPTKINVTKYKPLNHNEEFETLMSANDEPVFILNSTDRIGILGFSLNRSNLPLLMEFPTLINNFFNYFIPPTVIKNSFTVDEAIDIKARGYDVVIKNRDMERPVAAPATITLESPGIYEINQRLYSNRLVVDSIYVRIPRLQSEINRLVKENNDLFTIKRPKDATKDILIYLAGALFLVILLERFIRSRDNI